MMIIVDDDGNLPSQEVQVEVTPLLAVLGFLMTIQGY